MKIPLSKAERRQALDVRLAAAKAVRDRLDRRIGEAQTNARLLAERTHGAGGGRPGLTLEQLLLTEQLVGEHGSHEAGERLGLKYHAVKHRMRRLAKLRGDAAWTMRREKGNEELQRKLESMPGCEQSVPRSPMGNDK